MKNINRERVFISFMVIAAVSIASFVMMEGYQEGIFGHSWLVRLIIYVCRLCYFVCAFPNILLYMLGKLQNIVGFVLGVASGAFFHGFLIEFILIRYHSKNKS